ncbi:DUF1178 family protein [Alcaligenes aquatilis]|uniref:DUF1178 family protein n=1 Tax=Alcaligenes aquatilis TaxID=323284 RepID=A0A3G2HT19_9BURK|nr:MULTISPECIES: DUF1178 family protein [Alcaligenes]AYN20184.1 DUF1178 family protein [Alcaligenes aquatilis]HBQ89503.1 DUF1178 domain-containing protein [Alcaligenes faecalis]
MSLKVFDLECEHGHVFEGWFSSRESYDEQISRGLLCCPVCNSHEVKRKLSAPRINVGAQESSSAPATAPAPPPLPSTMPTEEQMRAIQGQLLQELRSVIRKSDNVGTQFAQEARRMHEGDIEPRAIRGQATAQEYQELADDGIIAMPIPDFLDDDHLQ